jgi:hypothetical protein
MFEIINIAKFSIQLEKDRSIFHLIDRTGTEICQSTRVSLIIRSLIDHIFLNRENYELYYADIIDLHKIADFLLSECEIQIN